MGIFVDLTGKKFNNLFVLKRSGNNGTRATWLCRCDCGNEIIVFSNKLTKGNQKGCLRCRKNRLVHGQAKKTSEYTSWQNMKSRCDDVNNKHYHNYGGRGIKYCESWSDFSHFYNDMGNKPSKYHSLERVDNNGGYCKDNCIWATRKEQANNQRKTIVIDINGVKKCALDWAKEFKIDAAVVTRRIKRGIDPITALTQKHILRTTINFNGQIISIREAERRLGWNKGTLAARKRNGFTDEEAISLPLNTKKRIINNA